MFDELEKYKGGHFFIKVRDDLADICNAPPNKSGVYIVYALAKGKIDLVYIGRSGEKDKDGNIRTRNAGYGGIKDRIINGKHLNGVAAKTSWPLQMELEKIEALEVYWYVTYDEVNTDFPEDVKRTLLQQYINLYGALPRWNKK